MMPAHRDRDKTPELLRHSYHQHSAHAAVNVSGCHTKRRKRGASRRCKRRRATGALCMWASAPSSFWCIQPCMCNSHRCSTEQPVRIRTCYLKSFASAANKSPSIRWTASLLPADAQPSTAQHNQRGTCFKLSIKGCAVLCRTHTGRLLRIGTFAAIKTSQRRERRNHCRAVVLLCLLTSSAAQPYLPGACSRCGLASLRGYCLLRTGNYCCCPCCQPLSLCPNSSPTRDTGLAAGLLAKRFACAAATARAKPDTEGAHF